MLHSVYELDNGNYVLRGERLTEQEIQQIIEDYESGVKTKDILAKFNISVSL